MPLAWRRPLVRPQLPLRRVMELILVMMHRRAFGYTGDARWYDASLRPSTAGQSAEARAIERLIEMGLVERVRSGSYRHRRTVLRLTEAGIDAAEAGRLDIPKPLARTQRREKRARHV